MAIDYLFYCDHSLNLSDVEAMAIADADFVSELPFREYTCLKAPGVSAQMRLVSQPELTVSLGEDLIKLNVKFEIFFNISKFDIFTGETNMLKFIKRLRKNYKNINWIVFNNENNAVPLAFSYKSEIYSYNIDFLEKLGDKIIKLFDNNIVTDRKLEIIY